MGAKAASFLLPVKQETCGCYFNDGPIGKISAGCLETTSACSLQGVPFHMQSGRFSLSNLSIKHRLPLLIGTLLLGIIIASTWASYRGVQESALAVGRERLQNLTQQLANLSQQSNSLLLTKTSTAANSPAIRAFLQSPSPGTRAGASRSSPAIHALAGSE